MFCCINQRWTREHRHGCASRILLLQALAFSALVTVPLFDLPARRVFRNRPLTWDRASSRVRLASHLRQLPCASLAVFVVSTDNMYGLVSCVAVILAALPFLAAPSSDFEPHHDKAILEYSAQDVVKQLQLIPNIEKGYYIQTFKDDAVVLGNRSASTAIYYLLEGEDGPSRWHRVADVEIWHYYAGAPLTLSLSYNNGSRLEVKTLGPNVFRKQAPQIVLGKQQWQSARSLGRWTLVGTTGKVNLLVLPFFIGSTRLYSCALVSIILCHVYMARCRGIKKSL
jgi:predicted cupin superfamily sugar epimerase